MSRNNASTKTPKTPAKQTELTVEDVAEIAYEAICVYERRTGRRTGSPPWVAAKPATRKAMIAGAKLLLAPRKASLKPSDVFPALGFSKNSRVPDARTEALIFARIADAVGGAVAL